MTRHRSISSIIGERPSRSIRTSTRQKRDKKVPCYCDKCNGKLVLKRTKLFHESSGSKIQAADTQHDKEPSLQSQHDAELPILRTESRQLQSPVLRGHQAADLPVLSRKHTKRHMGTLQ